MCPEEYYKNDYRGAPSSTVRVVRHWNKLPSDVVDNPCLETFKVRRGKALGNLI